MTRQPEPPRRPGTGAARRRATTTSGTAASRTTVARIRAVSTHRRAGRLPAAGEPAIRRGRGYPEQGGYRRAGGYPTGLPPSYEQRPPAGYGSARRGGGYRDQGLPAGARRLRPAARWPAGLRRPQGGGYDYGRQPTPGRHDGRLTVGEPRPAYPDQGGYPRPGRLSRPGRLRRTAVWPRQDYAQPDYGRYGEPPARRRLRRAGLRRARAAADTTTVHGAAGRGYGGGYGRGRLRGRRRHRHPAARRRQRPDLPAA